MGNGAQTQGQKCAGKAEYGAAGVLRVVMAQTGLGSLSLKVALRRDLPVASLQVPDSGGNQTAQAVCFSLQTWIAQNSFLAGLPSADACLGREVHSQCCRGLGSSLADLNVWPPPKHHVLATHLAQRVGTKVGGMQDNLSNYLCGSLSVAGIAQREAHGEKKNKYRNDCALPLHWQSSAPQTTSSQLHKLRGGTPGRRLCSAVPPGCSFGWRRGMSAFSKVVCIRSSAGRQDVCFCHAVHVCGASTEQASADLRMWPVSLFLPQATHRAPYQMSHKLISLAEVSTIHQAKGSPRALCRTPRTFKLRLGWQDLSGKQSSCFSAMRRSCH